LKYIRVLLVLVIGLLAFHSAWGGVVSGQTATGFDATGLDVIFVMEGSNRYDDPDSSRFSVFEYVAEVLSTDALFINPSAQHTLSLITHTDDSSSLILDAVPFGAYAQEGDPRFTDPDMREQREADIADLVQRVENQQGTMSQSLGGVENDLAGYASAFGRIDGLLNRMDSNGREQIIFLIFPLRPHLSNPVGGVFDALSLIRSTLGSRQIHTLVLPVDRLVETNPFLYDPTRNPNFADDWSDEQRSNNFSGDIVENIQPADMGQQIYRVIEGALSSVSNPMSAQVQRIPLDGLTSVNLPPFVSSAIFMGFDSFRVSPPRAEEPTTTSIDGNIVSVFESAPTGLYSVASGVSGDLILRFGTPTLTAGSPHQWERTQFSYVVSDAFNQPLESPVQGAVQSVTGTIAYQPTGQTWALNFQAESNQIGTWLTTFVPPYRGGYAVNLAVNLDYNGTISIPSPLLNPDDVRLNASAVQLQYVETDSIANAALDTPLLSRNTFALRLIGANQDSYAVLPTLTLTLPLNQTNSTSDSMQLAERDLEYSASGIRFVRLPAGNQPLAVQVTASLALPNQPDTNGLTTYALPEMNLTVPVNVIQPTIGISENLVEQTILTNSELIVTPTTSDQLTESDLAVSSAVLCAIFTSPSTILPTVIPLQSAGDNYTLSHDFVPTLPERYTVAITLVADSCGGEQIAALDDYQFTARPIYLSLINANDARSSPILTQFIPSALSFAFFSPLNGQLTRIEQQLDIPPRVTFAGNRVHPDDMGRYTVELLAPTQYGTQTITVNAAFTNINGVETPVFFAPTGTSNSVDLSVTPSVVEVEFMGASGGEPRQFDFAIIHASLSSVSGAQTYNTDQFINEGGRAVATISYSDDNQLRTMAFPLDYDTAQNLFQQTIPLPLGVTYTVSVQFLLNDVEVRETTGQETRSITARPVTLRFIDEAGVNQTSMYAEDVGSYAVGWFDEGSNTPILDTFAAEPVVTFADPSNGNPDSRAMTFTRTNGVYRFTWSSDEDDVYDLNLTWNVSAPARITESGEMRREQERGQSEAISVTVLPITAFYLQLTCGDINQECMYTTQTDDIDFVQPWHEGAAFWRRTLIGISETPQIRFDIVLRREEVLNQPARGENSLVSIEDVFGDVAPDQLLQIEVTDANGVPFPEQNLVLSKEGALTDLSLRFTLSSLPQDRPYLVNVRLRDTLEFNRGYIMRRASAPVYTVVLVLDQVSASLPLAAIILTGVIFLFLILVIYVVRIGLESHKPHVPVNSYLQFITKQGEPLGWSADISNLRRNVWRFRYDKRWSVVDVTSFEIRSAIKPDTVRIRLWRSLGPGNGLQKLVRRLRNSSMFLKEAPQVDMTLERDKIEPVYPGSLNYILLSSPPTTTPNKPSVQPSRVFAPKLLVSVPTPQPPPAAPIPVPNAAIIEAPTVSDPAPTPVDERSPAATSPALEEQETSEPISKLVPPSRPRRNLDDDPFADLN